MVLVEIGVFILDEKNINAKKKKKTLRRRSQFRAINGGGTYTTHSYVCNFSMDHSLNPTNRVLGCHRVTNKAEEAPPPPPLPNRLSPRYCVMQQGGSAVTLMVVEEVVRRPVLEGLRVDDAAWQQRAADPLGCM